LQHSTRHRSVSPATALVAALAAFGPGAMLAGEPLEPHRLSTQGLHRSYHLYRPATLAPRPALVVALHGSGGDGLRFRRLTGGAFDRVADEHGFIVAYPDALGRQWKDCRGRAPYQAALAGIDDAQFLRELVDDVSGTLGRELAGVFVVGYSNGGHMAFRLALEAPDAFDGFAAIAAHMPVAAENACSLAGEAVSVLLVSGTEDRINPWDGGPVRPPGGALLGHVLSAEASAARFASLLDSPQPVAVDRLPDRVPDDGATVEIATWRDETGHEVVLVSVVGGGHVLPHPTAPFPLELVGPTSRDVDGAELIWAFFERRLRRP
jgi:polyhydroxybutyrate depolymerase